MAIAALNFDSAGSTRRCAHGSDTSLDNLPSAGPFSFYAKIKETTGSTVNSHVIAKSGSAGVGWQMSLENGQVRIIVFHATTILDYISTSAVITTDVWTDVFVAIDTTLGAGLKVKIYISTEETLMSEVAMTASTEPTGAYTSDAASALWVGNIERANTNPFRGQIQKFFVSNVIVGIDEVNSISWESGTTLLAGVTGGVAADEYDDTGATQTGLINSTATDGTITGATAVTTGLYTLSTTTIAVTNTGIIFSPYNWRSVGGSGTMQINNILPTGTTEAVSNTPGAYIKFNITTAIGGNGLCALEIDPVNYPDLTAPPQVQVSVDGGSWSIVTLTANTTYIEVGGLTANATSTVEFFFKGVDLDVTADNNLRWTVPKSAIVVKGVIIDTDASVAAITKKTNDIFVIGDSFSEGAAVYGATADRDNNDAQAVWWNMVANSLDAEVGVQAFGGCGYIRGINNVAASATNPAMYNATNANEFWDKYSNGQSKLVGGLFVPVPDYIFIMAGSNDTGSITANLTALIDDVRTAAGTAAWIFVLTSQTGEKAAEIASGVAGAADTAKTKNLVMDVFYTRGDDSRFNEDTSHPNSLMQSYMASQISELACTQLEAGGSPSGVRNPLVGPIG